MFARRAVRCAARFSQHFRFSLTHMFRALHNVLKRPPADPARTTAVTASHGTIAVAGLITSEEPLQILLCLRRSRPQPVGDRAALRAGSGGVPGTGAGINAQDRSGLHRCRRSSL